MTNPAHPRVRAVLAIAVFAVSAAGHAAKGCSHAQDIQCKKNMWGDQIEINFDELLPPRHQVTEALTKVLHFSAAAPLRDGVELHEVKDLNFVGAIAIFENSTTRPRNGIGGKAQIYYGRNLTDAFVNGAPALWDGYAMLAHEAAHFALGHVFKADASFEQEAQADRMAGCVVARLGGTLDNAQSVYRRLAAVDAADKHPGREARLQFVKEGWMLASSEMGEDDKCPRAVRLKYPL